MADTEDTTKRKIGIDDPIQTHLGDKLREFYGSILAEPVPDRLTSLLDQLERQERAALTDTKDEDRE